MKSLFLACLKPFFSVLPPRVRGEMEYRLNDHHLMSSFGGPLNGMAARTEVCRRILTDHGWDMIIETGAYRGTTTEWLCRFGPPVVSMEVSERYFGFTQKRLSHCKHLDLRLGDSAAEMRKLSPVLQEKQTFAYLDAHWEDHLPLRDEISAISEHCAGFAIVIDDFRTPDDPGYGYDDYGPAGACTLEHIAPTLAPDVKIFFPSVPAEKETGKRRGWVVLARGDTTIKLLRECDLLREWVN